MTKDMHEQLHDRISKRVNSAQDLAVDIVRMSVPGGLEHAVGIWTSVLLPDTRDDDHNTVSSVAMTGTIAREEWVALAMEAVLKSHKVPEDAMYAAIAGFLRLVGETETADSIAPAA